jgi:hypothetical protein
MRVLFGLIRKADSVARDEDRDIRHCEDYKEIRGMWAKNQTTRRTRPLDQTNH